MRLLSLVSIQKKLDKKNSELLEVRALRKKLAEREKSISADIAFLQNQKVEAIFMQVKRGIKLENLDVSSESILPLLEALRNSQQKLNDTNSIDKITAQANDSISTLDKNTKLDSAQNLHSNSTVTETVGRLHAL